MHKRARAGMAALLFSFGLAREAAFAQTPAAAPLSLDAAVALALDRNAGYRIAHLGGDVYRVDGLRWLAEFLFLPLRHGRAVG